MGAIRINLNKAAERNQLNLDTPDKFFAISVHQERVLKVPSDSGLVAETDDCSHILSVISKPFWVFQFHPEVDKDTLVMYYFS